MSIGQRSPTTKLGYEEYCCFPNDGNRHEIIDGYHYMNPAPSTGHQSVSKHLQYQLYQKIELAKLGTIFAAPIDVQLGDYNIVQPDLVALTNVREQLITPSRIMGAPELLVEILSPGTAKNDRTLKRQLYQQFGVNEYWIVDPATQSVEQLVLVEGTYQQQETKPDLVLSFLSQVSIDTRVIW